MVIGFAQALDPGLPGVAPTSTQVVHVDEVRCLCAHSRLKNSTSGRGHNEKTSGSYTPEFRAEAVRVVLEQGIFLTAAVQRWSVAKGTRANWIKAARRGLTTLASLLGSRGVTKWEDAIARLHCKLAVERR